MTHGDKLSVKCPVCGSIVNDPLRGREPKQGDILEVTVECGHCHNMLYLWASWGVMVVAEKESEVQ